MSVELTGLGGWLPPLVVTNDTMSEKLDTTPAWISTRTGIEERRFVSGEQSTCDLAVEAGRAAMKSAGVSVVDAIVVATTSFERLCPAVAPEVAHKLGQGKIAAFDITSACSGFIYGLATASGFIEMGIAERVLLIGAEAFTSMVNPDDRATRPIFGDGGGAVVLQRSIEDRGCFAHFDLGSDGELSDLLAIPAGGARQRVRDGRALREAPFEEFFLHMEGRAIFLQAVTRMAASARAVLARSELSIDQIDWFVGHQANSRILHEVALDLELPPEKVAINIHRTGNTLTASIPLLLADLAADGDLKPGDRILLSAFGAGLSWGSSVFTWPDIDVAKVL